MAILFLRRRFCFQGGGSVDNCCWYIVVAPIVFGGYRVLSWFCYIAINAPFKEKLCGERERARERERRRACCLILIVILQIIEPRREISKKKIRDFASRLIIL